MCVSNSDDAHMNKNLGTESQDAGVQSPLLCIEVTEGTNRRLPRKTPYTGLPPILVLQRYYLHLKEDQTFACSFWEVISKPLKCHN